MSRMTLCNHLIASPTFAAQARQLSEELQLPPVLLLNAVGAAQSDKCLQKKLMSQQMLSAANPGTLCFLPNFHVIGFTVRAPGPDIRPLAPHL